MTQLKLKSMKYNLKNNLQIRVTFVNQKALNC